MHRAVCRLLLAVICLLLSLPSTSALRGQNATPVSPGVVIRRVSPSQTTSPSGIVVQESAVLPPGSVVQPMPATPDGAADAANAEEASPDARKLELLLAADYKRSTEAILDAWSHREEKGDDASAPEILPVSATVETALDTLVVLKLDAAAEWTVGTELTAIAADETSLRLRIVDVDGLAIVARRVAVEAEATTPSPDTESSQDTAEVQNNSESGDSQGEGANSDAETATETKSGDASPNPADTAADAPAESDDESAETTRDELELNAGDVLQLLPFAKPDSEEQGPTVEEEVAGFVRHVILGKWSDVKTFLETLEPTAADQVYARILESLAEAAVSLPDGLPPEFEEQIRQQLMQSNQQVPVSFLTPDDILQLTEASPRLIRIGSATKANGSGPTPADGISGRWSVLPSDMPVGAMPAITIEIRLSDNGQLAGVVKGPFPETISLTGSFDPSTSAFRLEGSVEGEKAIISGTVSGREMTGVLGGGSGDQIPFSGTLLESWSVESENESAAGDTTSDDSEESESADSDAAAPTSDGPVSTGSADSDEAEGSDDESTDHIAALATLIQLSLESGYDFGPFVEALKTGTRHFGTADREQRLATAKLLVEGGLVDDAELFLPELEPSIEENDATALRIWSDLAMAQYRKTRLAKWLDAAWSANQAILSVKSVADAARATAMTTLVELAPQMSDDRGETWITESFSESPQRGKEILANLGTRTASLSLQAESVSHTERFKYLKLQNQAVEGLVRSAPDQAAEWSDVVTLLARNWLDEARVAVNQSPSGNGGSYMQVDMYGNYYWVDQQQYNERYAYQQIRPISVSDLLLVRPGPEWLALTRASLHNEVRAMIASLHMRDNEEEQAFPYIEEVAASDPDRAKDLIHEFLNIWARNHDPNSESRMRNPYIYAYGYDMKAESIPLTRSKQERNLEELAEWVERIRALEIEGIDEKRIARAFTTCHSSAEVFHLDRLTAVFGDIGKLKPETTATICESMRGSLAGRWRAIRTQEEAKTNRREPDVQREVSQGYATALKLVSDALQAHPKSWQLHLTLATLLHDQNDWEQTIQKNSEFTEMREAAFDQFALAAKMYREVVPTLEQNEQSTEVYEKWFYAALGAVDLGNVSNKNTAVSKQFPLIRQSIQSLPGVAAEFHTGRFANNLFTRMSPIKPEVKFRYLRGGFEIVGDHPRAREARSLFDYYQDLVSEIRLDVEVDGPDRVGRDQPFGIYVSILHTNEIEREAGGFGKYVQNQNSMAYAYNYGRPTEDYRDKFSDAVSQALSEQFEILNITFESPDTMQSRALPQRGWRKTPYAYVLLKPLGKEVDRIAPLKLDMDFLDTSGYAVIPIESPALIIDASSATPIPRPASNVSITQTLDERRSGEGKLIVEISASAVGLVPDLAELIEIEREGFELVSIDDQGVLPSRFDPKSEEIQVLSDRSWTVEYKPRDNEHPPQEFAFGDVIFKEASFRFQRYDDADLVEAEQTVPLAEQYPVSNNRRWVLYGLVLFGGAGLIGLAIWLTRSDRTAEDSGTRYGLPDDVNPFSVLALLHTIRNDGAVSDDQREELDQAIHNIEASWFAADGQARGATNGHADDLVVTANHWINRSRR